MSHGHGDDGYDDTAFLSRMLGKLGFDGGIASWSSSVTRNGCRWASAFKSIRHLLVQDFHQLTQVPVGADDRDVLQFVDYAGAEAAVFAFAGRVPCTESVSLRGLQANAKYRAVRLNDDTWEEASGEQLMDTGLPIELGVDAAALWHIESVM